MSYSLFATLALAIAAPAAAQAPVVGSVQPAAGYERAPWWMHEPIIASSGHVRTEIQANRANFSANFQAVEKTAPAATRAAADKVKAIAEALKAFGADKVRIETTFSMRPLYDQYKDKTGVIQENQRADQIERYQVDANVALEIRDLAIAERVYATVLAGKPSSIGSVRFQLEPDNEIRTELFHKAVEDAARRAKLAVEAAGTRLGAVKLVDPTGRACQTDVLVSGANRGGGGGSAADLQEVVLTATRQAAPAPPPPSPAGAPLGGGLSPEDMQLPLQPPMQRLEATACVIYALASS